MKKQTWSHGHSGLICEKFKCRCFINMLSLSHDQAQLKLVTHERDNLKKDVKRISQVRLGHNPKMTVNNWTFKERDGAYRHLSLSASPQSSLETPTSHHRTNSDTAPTVAKSGTVQCGYYICLVASALL